MIVLKSTYVAAFALAALVCFAGVRRANRLTQADTRRGLVALLLTTGAWSTAHVGRFVAPGTELKVASYVAGLVFGLASVGAWLYFCSAYAGHDYHRSTVLRRTAVVAYLAVVGVKLTNPIHGLYFEASLTTTPFRHLGIELHPIHWVVTALAYSLSAVGFYLLYELFRESRFDTRALGGLVAVTALPAALDVLAYTDVGPLPTLNYEPLGVAVFAVGVLYVVDETFVAVPYFWRRRVIESLGDAVVLLDVEERVRDYNAAAAEVFGLAGGSGERFDALAPRVADALDAGEDVVAVGEGESARYVVPQVTDLSVGPTPVGSALVFTDVTEVERQRRELRRHGEQLDDLAEAITHELRNTVEIARGHVDVVAGELVDAPEETVDPRVRESLSAANEALDRMTRVVGDLSTLARYGRIPDEFEPCPLAGAARAAWEDVPTDGMGLDLTAGGSVSADPLRLEHLFRNAFEFAAANGATTVAVATTGDGFTVTGDGDPIPGDRVDRAFEYGEAVPSAETGVLLPNVETLARVHGWSVSVDPDYREGVRIRVSGVAVNPAGAE